MAGRSQHPVQIMENQTRFDLNAAIESWRNELAAQPNLASDDRRELETHLSDTIAGFQQRGLNDEESFCLARHRVGQPQLLGEEFVKVDPAKVWRKCAFWIVATVLVLNIWYSISTFGSTFVFQILISPFQDHYYIQGLRIPFDILFHTLPIVWVMILLANGRLVRLFAKLSAFFCSQMRLGIGALLAVIGSLLLANYTQWLILSTNNPLIARAIPPFGNHFFRIFSADLAPSLIFIGLLVWLMPTQNRKTPKRT